MTLQLDFFGPPIAQPGQPQRSRREPVGWRRLSPPGAKLDARWRHDSGWEVRHCGHPTANFPYFAVDLAGRSRVPGRGFRRLVEAQAAVEDVDAREQLFVLGRPR